MNRLALFAVGAGALAAVAAGCSSSTTSTASGSGGSATTSSGAAIVKTASSSLGTVLVDGSGRTLYMFKHDTGSSPTCTGSCASIWPPDDTTGTPQGTGVSSSMLGTTASTTAHATQVTFDGHPLYYYSGDSKAGQVNGQGVQGIWFAVSPSGSAITTTPAPSTSSTGNGGYGY
ncbi:COG4315 family predicted lipoprotein [Actinospica acidithermotolerans]|nr:hypothetical protein [Actinospica acidithermotolerans]